MRSTVAAAATLATKSKVTEPPSVNWQHGFFQKEVVGGSNPLGGTMKVTIHEHGVELEPENEHERQALAKIANKSLTAKWENSWDQCGSLKLEFEPHPWDKR